MYDNVLLLYPFWRERKCLYGLSLLTSRQLHKLFSVLMAKYHSNLASLSSSNLWSIVILGNVQPSLWKENLSCCRDFDPNIETREESVCSKECDGKCGFSKVRTCTREHVGKSRRVVKTASDGWGRVLEWYRQSSCARRQSCRMSRSVRLLITGTLMTSTGTKSVTF